MKRNSVFYSILFFTLICLSVKQKTCNAANKQDSLALVALYNATGGEGWSDHRNWLITPVKYWWGITLDTNGRVVDVFLARNNLTGSIPDEFYGMDKVKEVWLGDNKLTGTMSGKIENMISLRTFEAKGNNLTGSIPPEIGNLSELKTLYLSENNLTGSIPSEIGNAKNLKDLLITDNLLTGSIPPEIGNLKFLQAIYLYNNNLTGIIPPEIGGCSCLTQLYLQNNNMTGVIPTEMSTTCMVRAYLSNNNFDGLEDLSSLKYLTVFAIENNGLSFKDLDVAKIKVNNNNYYTYSLQKENLKRTTIGNKIILSYEEDLSDNAYKWFKNGVKISGQINSSLTISNADKGMYHCEVTNASFPKLTIISEKISFNITTYKVTFNDFDGNELKSETIEQGKSATVPANPIRSGYVFTNWDKDFDKITTDLIITAQYVVITGIKNIVNINAQIYPNPIVDILNINFNKNYEVEIYNSMGKIIFKHNTNCDKIRINTSSWKASTYIIVVKSDNAIYRSKLIKL